jgi:hypothetical protein
MKAFFRNDDSRAGLSALVMIVTLLAIGHWPNSTRRYRFSTSHADSARRSLVGDSTIPGAYSAA